MHLKSNPPKLSQDEAESIAISALGFIAGDQSRLAQFLAMTGYSPGAIRAEAGSPDFLAGVLEFLLSDESQLLVFTSHNQIDPLMVAEAKRVLADDF